MKNYSFTLLAKLSSISLSIPETKKILQMYNLSDEKCEAHFHIVRKHFKFPFYKLYQLHKNCIFFNISNVTTYQVYMELNQE